MVDKKVIDNLIDRGADDELIIEELETKIDKMIDDRDAKCASAKEHLIDTLKITADKYRTATGVMEALRVMRMVYGDSPDTQFINQDIRQAKKMAETMAATALEMADDVKYYSYEDMHMLCDGYYDKDFIAIEDTGITAMSLELMKIDLCRNVGPAAEDISEFYKHAEEEINDTVEELKKAKNKED